MKDYYQTLGIAPKASFEEIKKAYRSLVHRYHPDKNSGASSSIIFQEIQEAYTVLSDSRQKQLYEWFLMIQSKPNVYPRKGQERVCDSGLKHMVSDIDIKLTIHKNIVKILAPFNTGVCEPGNIMSTL